MHLLLPLACDLIAQPLAFACCAWRSDASLAAGFLVACCHCCWNRERESVNENGLVGNGLRFN